MRVDDYVCAAQFHPNQTHDHAGDGCHVDAGGCAQAGHEYVYDRELPINVTILPRPCKLQLAKTVTKLVR